MTSPNDKSPASANLPAKGSSSIAKLSPELVRNNFHALLLANPNYFGNLTERAFKPVLNIQGYSACESLGCVGYSFTLYVWDRTNVDSGVTSNWNYASTGFCLQGGN